MEPGCMMMTGAIASWYRIEIHEYLAFVVPPSVALVHVAVLADVDVSRIDSDVPVLKLEPEL
jgi:hypothetical protein